MDGPLVIGDLVVIVKSEVPRLLGKCGEVVGLPRPDMYVVFADGVTGFVDDHYMLETGERVTAPRECLLKITPPDDMLKLDEQERLVHER